MAEAGLKGRPSSWCRRRRVGPCAASLCLPLAYFETKHLTNAQSCSEGFTDVDSFKLLIPDGGVTLLSSNFIYEKHIHYCYSCSHDRRLLALKFALITTLAWNDAGHRAQSWTWRWKLWHVSSATKSTGSGVRLLGVGNLAEVCLPFLSRKIEIVA